MILVLRRHCKRLEVQRQKYNTPYYGKVLIQAALEEATAVLILCREMACLLQKIVEVTSTLGTADPDAPAQCLFYLAYSSSGVLLVSMTFTVTRGVIYTAE